MRKFLLSLCAALLLSGAASAQWAVFDPTNFAGNLSNSIKEIVQTSTTASNMVKNFQETVKIYEQGKAYYDALKSVHNLVKDARKVQQTILLVGDISDIYVKNFQRMMNDENFSVDELAAIAAGYAKLLEQGSFMLADLRQVTTSTGLSMSDKERMDVIDGIYTEVLRYRNLTQYYTRKNISVSYLRSKDTKDMARVRALYGTQDERYW